MCKDVKGFTEEYGKIEDEIKAICTDRACTTDAILKILNDKGIKLDVATLLSMLGQILGMMFFDKKPTYEVGDSVVYEKGMIFKSKQIGRLLVEVKYKKFYLYNPARNGIDAFHNCIQNKLEFEVSEKNTITCSEDLERALYGLDISSEEWKNYVFIFGNKVFRIRYDISYRKSFKDYAGKLIGRVPPKEIKIKIGTDEDR